MTNLRVVGLDISTYTGVALASGEEIIGKTIDFPKLRGLERLHLIAQETERVIKLWQPDLIVIEGYAIYRASSAVTVVSCGAVVRYVLYQMGFGWWEVPPSSLKKWTTGRGNASKDEMAVSVKSRWGYASPSDDIVDAVALAKLGQAVAQNMQWSSIKGVSCHGKLAIHKE